MVKSSTMNYFTQPFQLLPFDLTSSNFPILACKMYHHLVDSSIRCKFAMTLYTLYVMYLLTSGSTLVGQVCDVIL